MPTIAIIGRPNAGKSTLFNALIGHRKAIESEIAGTTRDRVFGTRRGEFLDLFYVDTGGLTTDTHTSIEEDMRRQAQESISGADCIYFCVDVREELTAEEQTIVTILRRHKPAHIPVFLVGTKAERMNSQDMAGDLYGLGITEQELFFVSAQQNHGIKKLVSATESILLQNGFSDTRGNQTDTQARICILGRPNAGKSTLINTLSGQNISIVSPESGTTRDNVDSLVRFEKKSFLLIDTAGIRKKSSMNKESIERYSRMRALSALARADIALLLIDATDGITHQDQSIAAELQEAGVGVMILFSKWDIAKKNLREEIIDSLKRKEEFKTEPVSSETKEEIISRRSLALRERFLSHAQKKLGFLSWAPVTFLSSLEKKGIQEIFRNVERIMQERTKHISTKNLNMFLEQSLALHPPASKGTKKFSVKYMLQKEGESPPSFLLFANDPDLAHFSFRRFIENRLREAYGFWGTPIDIEIRRK